MLFPSLVTIPPRRKNPKNAQHATAHMTPVCGLVVETKWSWMSVNIWNVMGNLIREEEPLSMAARLIPAWTRVSIGNDDWSLGSGRPSEICIFLTAER